MGSIPEIKEDSKTKQKTNLPKKNQSSIEGGLAFVLNYLWWRHLEYAAWQNCPVVWRFWPWQPNNMNSSNLWRKWRFNVLAWIREWSLATKESGMSSLLDESGWASLASDTVSLYSIANQTSKPYVGVRLPHRPLWLVLTPTIQSGPWQNWWLVSRRSKLRVVLGPLSLCVACFRYLLQQWETD